MIKQQIYVSQWLQVPTETRNKLIELFNLRKSGVTSVVNNVVISDGFTDLDLSDLTIDKLQKYLGSKDKDIISLLENAIVKINTPEPVKIITPEVAILGKAEAKKYRKEYEARKKVAKVGKVAKKSVKVGKAKVKKLGKRVKK